MTTIYEITYRCQILTGHDEDGECAAFSCETRTDMKFNVASKGDALQAAKTFEARLRLKHPMSDADRQAFEYALENDNENWRRTSLGLPKGCPNNKVINFTIQSITPVAKETIEEAL